MVSLVNGGAGFIGSKIAAPLIREDEQVRILDDFPTTTPNLLRRMADDFDLAHGDRHDPRALAKAVSLVQVIYHQPALPSVPQSIEDIVDGNLLAASSYGARGATFNPFTNSPKTILETLNTIPCHLGVEPDPKVQAELPGDPRISIADLSEARIHLGFYPHVSRASVIKPNVTRPFSLL